MTAERVRADRPDAVVIATGSIPIVPLINGVQGKNVVFASDVLLGNVMVGMRVVVIGGGLVGAETAHYLAESGCDVSIVEMLPQIAKDGEPSANFYLLQYLSECHVAIYTSARVTDITEDTLTFETTEGSHILTGVDTVILAVGMHPSHPLVNELDGYSGSIFLTGDARKVKNGYYNIQESFEIGLGL